MKRSHLTGRLYTWDAQHGFRSGASQHAIVSVAAYLVFLVLVHIVWGFACRRIGRATIEQLCLSGQALICVDRLLKNMPSQWCKPFTAPIWCYYSTCLTDSQIHVLVNSLHLWY